MSNEPRELAIDPAAVTRLDTLEEHDPLLGIVWSRMTVGTAPDGTASVILEERLTEHGERDASAPLAVQAVWGYDSVEAARRDRAQQMGQAGAQ
ncbi:MAG TPA: hypothetical protein VKZ89_20855 [Thermobifida alba]|nr:hypothetical protein [Thermobifida alba]